MDTLKRALKKVRVTPTEKALQQFLQVYRITLKNRTPASQSSSEVMFACRIWSVYDRLLPKQMKPGRTTIIPTKCYNPGEVFFRIFKDNKSFWEVGMIDRRVGNMMYIVKVHNSCIKDILTNLGDAYQMRRIAVLRRKQWWMSATTLLIFQPL